MKRILFAIAAAALSISAAAQIRNFDATVIKTTKLTNALYMLEDEGGNIGLSVGEDGLFVIAISSRR